MTTPDTTPDAPRLNRRQASKVRTRARILKAARGLFKAKSYQAATIRDIARAAGMSTGAIFATVKDKTELWREAMGCEPPVDTIDNPILRAAPLMQDALRTLLAARSKYENTASDHPALAAAWAMAATALAVSEPAPEAEEQRAA